VQLAIHPENENSDIGANIVSFRIILYYDSVNIRLNTLMEVILCESFIKIEIY